MALTASEDELRSLLVADVLASPVLRSEALAGQTCGIIVCPSEQIPEERRPRVPFVVLVETGGDGEPALVPVDYLRAFRDFLNDVLDGEIAWPGAAFSLCERCGGRGRTDDGRCPDCEGYGSQTL